MKKTVLKHQFTCWVLPETFDTNCECVWIIIKRSVFSLINHFPGTFSQICLHVIKIQTLNWEKYGKMIGRWRWYLKNMSCFARFSTIGKIIKNIIHGGVLLLVLKVKLLRGCFLHVSNCTNDTKSRKASLWGQTKSKTWSKITPCIYVERSERC